MTTDADADASPWTTIQEWTIKQLLAVATDANPSSKVDVSDTTILWHLLYQYCVTCAPDAKSEAALWFLCRHGLGGKPQNLVVASTHCQRAARLGHAPAAIALADASSHEPVARLMWLQMAADYGDVEARYRVAKAFAGGIGTVKDEARAMSEFEACGNEHGPALRRRGQLLMEQKSPISALPLFMQAANLDDWDACVEAYKLLSSNAPLYGTVLERSFGFSYLQRAAAHGEHTNACLLMGDGYSDGLKAPDFTFGKNMMLAAHYYERAAAGGSARALYHLGRFYEHGHHYTKSMSKALEYYQRSADKDDAWATFQLGDFYLLGREKALDDGKSNLAVDEKKGFAYMATSARKLNYYGAWHRLGKCYAEGKGTAVDEEESIRCWKTAAKLGSTLAEAALGAYYEAQSKMWNKR